MNGSVLAAISPQWIGIAVAAAIVVALLVILIIRRAADGKSDRRPDPAVGDEGSALAEIPAPPGSDASFLDEPLQRGFDGLGKPASGQPALGTIVTPRERPPAEQLSETAPEPPAPEPATLKETPPAAPGAAALSDIIVTTNQQEIDLTDPEVRQMLEELVANEIALAEAYRQQGQILDAILQLTEAEKACKALGDDEQAERIKALMKELQP